MAAQVEAMDLEAASGPSPRQPLPTLPQDDAMDLEAASGPSPRQPLPTLQPSSIPTPQPLPTLQPSAVSTPQPSPIPTPQPSPAEQLPLPRSEAVKDEEWRQFLYVMNEFIKYGNNESMYITDWRPGGAAGNEVDRKEWIKTNLFKMTQIISDSYTIDNITYKDICISVFGYYYKINLIDHPDWQDILQQLIKQIADNSTHVHNLILDNGH